MADVERKFVVYFDMFLGRMLLKSSFDDSAHFYHYLYYNDCVDDDSMKAEAGVGVGNFWEFH
jgi:hypothetical protein